MARLKNSIPRYIHGALDSKELNRISKYEAPDVPRRISINSLDELTFQNSSDFTKSYWDWIVKGWKSTALFGVMAEKSKYDYEQEYPEDFGSQLAYGIGHLAGFMADMNIIGRGIGMLAKGAQLINKARGVSDLNKGAGFINGLFNRAGAAGGVKAQQNLMRTGILKAQTITNIEKGINLETKVGKVIRATEWDKFFKGMKKINTTVSEGKMVLTGVKAGKNVGVMISPGPVIGALMFGGNMAIREGIAEPIDAKKFGIRDDQGNIVKAADEVTGEDWAKLGFLGRKAFFDDEQWGLLNSPVFRGFKDGVLISGAHQLFKAFLTPHMLGMKGWKMPKALSGFQREGIRTIVGESVFFGALESMGVEDPEQKKQKFWVGMVLGAGLGGFQTATKTKPLREILKMGPAEASLDPWAIEKGPLKIKLTPEQKTRGSVTVDAKTLKKINSRSAHKSLKVFENEGEKAEAQKAYHRWLELTEAVERGDISAIEGVESKALLGKALKKKLGRAIDFTEGQLEIETDIPWVIKSMRTSPTFRLLKNNYDEILSEIPNSLFLAVEEGQKQPITKNVLSFLKSVGEKDSYSFEEVNLILKQLWGPKFEKEFPKFVAEHKLRAGQFPNLSEADISSVFNYLKGKERNGDLSGLRIRFRQSNDSAIQIVVHGRPNGIKGSTNARLSKNLGKAKEGKNGQKIYTVDIETPQGKKKLQIVDESNVPWDKRDFKNVLLDETGSAKEIADVFEKVGSFEKFKEETISREDLKNILLDEAVNESFMKIVTGEKGPIERAMESAKEKVDKANKSGEKVAPQKTEKKEKQITLKGEQKKRKQIAMAAVAKEIELRRMKAKEESVGKVETLAKEVPAVQETVRRTLTTLKDRGLKGLKKGEQTVKLSKKQKKELFSRKSINALKKLDRQELNDVQVLVGRMKPVPKKTTPYTRQVKEKGKPQRRETTVDTITKYVINPKTKHIIKIRTQWGETVLNTKKKTVTFNVNNVKGKTSKFGSKTTLAQLHAGTKGKGAIKAKEKLEKEIMSYAGNKFEELNKGLGKNGIWKEKKGKGGKGRRYNTEEYDQAKEDFSRSLTNIIQSVIRLNPIHVLPAREYVNRVAEHLMKSRLLDATYNKDKNLASWLSRIRAETYDTKGMKELKEFSSPRLLEWNLDNPEAVALNGLDSIGRMTFLMKTTDAQTFGHEFFEASLKSTWSKGMKAGPGTEVEQAVFQMFWNRYNPKENWKEAKEKLSKEEFDNRIKSMAESARENFEDYIFLRTSEAVIDSTAWGRVKGVEPEMVSFFEDMVLARTGLIRAQLDIAKMAGEMPVEFGIEWAKIKDKKNVHEDSYSFWESLLKLHDRDIAVRDEGLGRLLREFGDRSEFITGRDRSAGDLPLVFAKQTVRHHFTIADLISKKTEKEVFSKDVWNVWHEGGSGLTGDYMLPPAWAPGISVGQRQGLSTSAFSRGIFIENPDMPIPLRSILKKGYEARNTMTQVVEDVLLSASEKKQFEGNVENAAYFVTDVLSLVNRGFLKGDKRVSVGTVMKEVKDILSFATDMRKGAIFRYEDKKTFFDDYRSANGFSEFNKKGLDNPLNLWFSGKHTDNMVTSILLHRGHPEVIPFFEGKLSTKDFSPFKKVHKSLFPESEAPEFITRRDLIRYVDRLSQMTNLSKSETSLALMEGVRQMSKVPEAASIKQFQRNDSKVVTEALDAINPSGFRRMLSERTDWDVGFKYLENSLENAINISTQKTAISIAENIVSERVGQDIQSGLPSAFYSNFIEYVANNGRPRVFESITNLELKTNKIETTTQRSVKMPDILLESVLTSMADGQVLSKTFEKVRESNVYKKIQKAEIFDSNDMGELGTVTHRALVSEILHKIGGPNPNYILTSRFMTRDSRTSKEYWKTADMNILRQTLRLDNNSIRAMNPSKKGIITKDSAPAVIDLAIELANASEGISWGAPGRVKMKKSSRQIEKLLEQLDEWASTEGIEEATNGSPTHYQNAYAFVEFIKERSGKNFDKLMVDVTDNIMSGNLTLEGGGNRKLKSLARELQAINSFEKAVTSPFPEQSGLIGKLTARRGEWGVRPLDWYLGMVLQGNKSLIPFVPDYMIGKKVQGLHEGLAKSYSGKSFKQTKDIWDSRIVEIFMREPFNTRDVRVLKQLLHSVPDQYIFRDYDGKNMLESLRPGFRLSMTKHAGDNTWWVETPTAEGHWRTRYGATHEVNKDILHFRTPRQIKQRSLVDDLKVMEDLLASTEGIHNKQISREIQGPLFDTYNWNKIKSFKEGVRYGSPDVGLGVENLKIAHNVLRDILLPPDKLPTTEKGVDRAIKKLYDNRIVADYVEDVLISFGFKDGSINEFLMMEKAPKLGIFTYVNEKIQELAGQHIAKFMNETVVNGTIQSFDGLRVVWKKRPKQEFTEGKSKFKLDLVVPDGHNWLTGCSFCTIKKVVADGLEALRINNYKRNEHLGAVNDIFYNHLSTYTTGLVMGRKYQNIVAGMTAIDGKSSTSFGKMVNDARELQQYMKLKDGVPVKDKNGNFILTKLGRNSYNKRIKKIKDARFKEAQEEHGWTRKEFEKRWKHAEDTATEVYDSYQRAAIELMTARMKASGMTNKEIEKALPQQSLKGYSNHAWIDDGTVDGKIQRRAIANIISTRIQGTDKKGNWITGKKAEEMKENDKIDPIKLKEFHDSEMARLTEVTSEGVSKAMESSLSKIGKRNLSPAIAVQKRRRLLRETDFFLEEEFKELHRAIEKETGKKLRVRLVTDPSEKAGLYFKSLGHAVQSHITWNELNKSYVPFDKKIRNAKQENLIPTMVAEGDTSVNKRQLILNALYSGKLGKNASHTRGTLDTLKPKELVDKLVESGKYVEMTPDHWGKGKGRIVVLKESKTLFDRAFVAPEWTKYQAYKNYMNINTAIKKLIMYNPLFHTWNLLANTVAVSSLDRWSVKDLGEKVKDPKTGKMKWDNTGFIGELRRHGERMGWSPHQIKQIERIDLKDFVLTASILNGLPKVFSKKNIGNMKADPIDLSHPLYQFMVDNGFPIGITSEVGKFDIKNINRPGVDIFKGMRKISDDMLWHVVSPATEAYVFYTTYRRMSKALKKDNPTWTADEIKRVAGRSAERIATTLSGKVGKMDMSPAYDSIGGAVMFANHWTVSNFRHSLGMVGMGSNFQNMKGAAKSLQQQYVGATARFIVYKHIMAQLLNKAVTDRWTWENEEDKQDRVAVGVDILPTGEKRYVYADFNRFLNDIWMMAKPSGIKGAGLGFLLSRGLPIKGGMAKAIGTAAATYYGWKVGSDMAQPLSKAFRTGLGLSYDSNALLPEAENIYRKLNPVFKVMLQTISNTHAFYKKEIISPDFTGSEQRAEYGSFLRTELLPFNRDPLDPAELRAWADGSALEKQFKGLGLFVSKGQTVSTYQRKFQLLDIAFSSKKRKITTDHRRYPTPQLKRKALEKEIAKYIKMKQELTNKFRQFLEANKDII